MLKIHLAQPERHQPSQALPVRHLVYKARKLQLLWLRKNPDRMLRYVRKELLYGIRRPLYLNSQLLASQEAEDEDDEAGCGCRNEKLEGCRSLLN